MTRHSTTTFAWLCIAAMTAWCATPINAEELYAANIDTRESNLARINTDDLPAAWQRELETAPDEVSAAALVGPGRRLYPWLLGGVLLLLLAETYVAWHVGNRAL